MEFVWVESKEVLTEEELLLEFSAGGTMRPFPKFEVRWKRKLNLDFCAFSHKLLKCIDFFIIKTRFSSLKLPFRP
ncbi:hypothetical protein C1887_06320 [Pseudomonas sp. GW456-R21]|nr:hypothetical protein C1887_06320 [Pseudomonas sp. GW456-R21]